MSQFANTCDTVRPLNQRAMWPLAVERQDSKPVLAIAEREIKEAKRH